MDNLNEPMCCEDCIMKRVRAPIIQQKVATT